RKTEGAAPLLGRDRRSLSAFLRTLAGAAAAAAFLTFGPRTPEEALGGWALARLLLALALWLLSLFGWGCLITRAVTQGESPLRPELRLLRRLGLGGAFFVFLVAAAGALSILSLRGVFLAVLAAGPLFLPRRASPPPSEPATLLDRLFFASFLLVLAVGPFWAAV